MDRTTERTAEATTSIPSVNGQASNAAQVFPGESEMARLMRAKDWSRTPLGAVETWSPSLRMMVSFLLANRFPLLLWWGPEFLQFYNDAYRPVLGTKHPQYLGRSVRECWAEIWDVIGPLIETPFNGGPATWMEDIFLEVNRHGFTEETHFTIAYSPVPDDTAPRGIGGVLATVHEISEKVVGERRVLALRDLGARAAEAKTAEEACAIAADTLSQHPKDIPFALLYLIDSDSHQARLVARAGVAQNSPLAPDVIALDAEPGVSDDDSTGSGDWAWPLAEAVRGETIQVVDDLALRRTAEAVPPGPWSDSPTSAVVVPIRSNIAHQLAGLLVAGVSARLRLDDGYAGFYELVSSQIATAIANARAYEEERRRVETLATLDRAKTAFFSNVSHEFRTPLTLMLGPLDDLLADDRGALSADAREQVEVVHRNGLRLAKLVNTLLDFSRIEAGRAQASYAPTDLAALTADLASAFRSLVERAGLRYVVDCPPLGDALSQPVYVDRDMWEKIVLNLVSNAFKFTFEGSITVTLRPIEGGASPAATDDSGGEASGASSARGGTGPATTAASNGNGVAARPASPSAVELEVRDSGTGIPAAELPRLFERFHQVQGTRARTHEGSGIGLALVQELVHLHGGTIRVESTEGVGTSVLVRLPSGAAHLPPDRVGVHATLASTALGAAPFVHEAERWLPEGAAARDGRAELLPDLLSAQAPAARAAPVSAAQTARILLADDNADMRDYLRRLLGERYEVEAVANGAQALAAIRRQPPDLVLSDVMMPELDGFALLRTLRGDPATRALPVILLSARAGEEATVEGLEAGAEDYLIKPFSAREVLSRVAARLEIARLRREAEARARELETAVEAVADAVFIYDRAGTIAHMNSAARTLFGLDALPGYAEGTPRQRTALIAARDEQGHPLPAEQSGLYRLLRGEALTGANAMDMRLRLPDGRELEVNIAGAPLRDETGDVIGAIAISRDVTERKRLERRTREALDALLRLAAAIVSVPGENSAGPEAAEPGSAPQAGELLNRLAALCSQVLDSERVAIIAVKPGSDFLRPVVITGSSRDQERLFRASFDDLSLAACFGPEIVSRLRAGESVLIDVSSLRADDPTHILSRRHFLMAPMLSAGELIGYLGVNFGDEAHRYTPQNRALALAVAQLVGMVMERERLAHEREEALASERAAEEANRRMNDFLGIASHELRTPLTSVTANVQMAERALRPLAEATRGESRADVDATLRHTHEMLERAKRQVVRLDRLVGDLLDASRIQANKLELRWEICDLRAVVREAVETQRAAWPGRSISLTMPRDANSVVRADADRIGQVVTNYLTNALKYSARDRPVAVCLRRHRGGVQVEVHDEGPGLSAEQQRHLFERFARAPGIEQISGSGVGLGLGLYICKTIVERHGGRLGVKSAPGEGSTFWFTLPLPLPPAQRGA
ncbi:MAG TPA: ATP-binding protein [Ktedonobacterales bacterium]